jgi:hypothetical protein
MIKLTNAHKYFGEKENRLHVLKGIEVETGPQEFEKREIQTGLSDGINIEVLDGITEQTKFKKLAQ